MIRKPRIRPKETSHSPSPTPAFALIGNATSSYRGCDIQYFTVARRCTCRSNHMSTGLQDQRRSDGKPLIEVVPWRVALVHRVDLDTLKTVPC